MPGRKPAPPLHPYKTAEAYRFRWFYVIESWIASGASVLDPEGVRLRLELDASPQEIGEAVKTALDASRFMPRDSHSFAELFRRALKATPDEDAARFLEMAPVRTRTSLYRDARNCGIRTQGSRIIITPMEKDGPGGWSGMRRVEDIDIPEAADAAEIGRALLRGFELAR